MKPRPGAPFLWRCVAWRGDVRRIVGEGEAATWPDALRAIERAAGWDRRLHPYPHADVRRDAVGAVLSPGNSLWTATGGPT